MAAPVSDKAGIRQAIRALKADGWELAFVNDGDYEDVAVSTETEAIDAITAVDDASLHVTKGTDTGWVRFVMGNEPDEVVCDYTTNLTAIDTLTDGWY
jgi:hypothetical protein